MLCWKRDTDNMRNGQYLKRLKFRVSLTKPKIYRFGPEHNNPHATTKVILDADNNEVITGCTCQGCMAHLRLLSKYNPIRFKALTQPVEMQGFKRNKALPEHVHIRRNLAKAMLKWR